MIKRDELVSFRCYARNYEFHKGFYNDSNPEEALYDINYVDFFDAISDDVNFAYDNAYPLLRGSCHLFALSLSKILGYNSYIIESKDKKGFHAFCQIVRKYQLFYIDARGMTTSFDEFMNVAKDFINGEFVIREITPQDIEAWKRDEIYYEEAIAFAEAIIKKFEKYYCI